MPNKTLNLVVGPGAEEGDGTLSATFEVPDLIPSLPHTVYSGTLSDGTPVKVDVVAGPKPEG